MFEDDFCKKLVITGCHYKTGTDTTACTHVAFAFHGVLSTWEFTTNSPVTGTAAESRRSTFAPHSPIYTQEPTTNPGFTGTNIACPDHGQKRGNPLQTCMSWEQIWQIADAADSCFTV